MNGENEAVRLNAAVDDDHYDGKDDGKENLVQFQNKQVLKLDHFYVQPSCVLQPPEEPQNSGLC